MKYLVKRTNDLTPPEKKQLLDLFGHVFPMKLSLEDFENKYRSIPSGYSYHSLMINRSERIVGAFTCIPSFYNFFGKVLKFSIAVDTMIHEDFRDDLFALKRMHDLSIEVMKDDGVSFVFAIPNLNAYLYWIKVVKWVDFGELNYYVLPIDLSKIDAKFRFVTRLTKAYAFLTRFFFSVHRSPLSQKPICLVLDQAFFRYRFGEKYQQISEAGKVTYYRIYDESGTRTAYVIDAYPLERTWLQRSVQLITIKEMHNLDLIVYAGRLDFRISNLLRVPRKYEPMKIRLTGKILDESQVDVRIFEIDNWQLSLADFDVK